MQKSHTRRKIFFYVCRKFRLFIYFHFFTSECQAQMYAPHAHIHAQTQQSLTVVVAVLPEFFFCLPQCNISISARLFVFNETVWCKVLLGFLFVFFFFFRSPSLVYFLSSGFSLLIFDHNIFINNPRNNGTRSLNKTKILIYYCLSTHTHIHTLTHAHSHPEFFLRVCVCVRFRVKRGKNPVSAISIT